MKYKTAAFTIGIFLVIVSLFLLVTQKYKKTTVIPHTWEVRSIDTMKYSRDIAREKINDPAFDEVINAQLKAIAQTGASHVAVGTPYDNEFVPFLKRWVIAARRYNLGVWFRGNLSGWEGWFDYSGIDRKTHTQKTIEFIKQNKDLFQNGDVFTSCPECENGGPGDPRLNGDVKGYREFLTNEYNQVKKTFADLNLNIKSNYYSMNADVAKLIMDPETTKALDGLVVIDHYVKDPARLERDIIQIAALSKGELILGEFGAPIPDLHGNFSEADQALWINQSLYKFIQLPQLKGINYWVNVGGSTQLWDSKGKPRQAVDVLQSYFKPSKLSITLKSKFGKPIIKARLNYAGRILVSDSKGKITLPLFPQDLPLTISSEHYKSRTVMINSNFKQTVIYLDKSDESFVDKLLLKLFPTLRNR